MAGRPSKAKTKQNKAETKQNKAEKI